MTNMKTTAKPFRQRTARSLQPARTQQHETEHQLLTKRSENERYVLEQLAKNQPLADFLNCLVLSYEALLPDTLCSVLLLDRDGQHLHHGAAPSLPPSYWQAIDGVKIGATVGSCGTAAFTGKTTFVTDIATDPLWRDYKNLALSHQLAACWSIPIFSSQKKVLGAFALYYHTPRLPQKYELETMGKAAHFAALAIERTQKEQELLRSQENLKRAQAVAETGSWVTDIHSGHIEWTEETYRIFGVVPSQAITFELFLSYIHPDDRAKVIQAWTAALAGETYDVEHRIVVKDEIRYVRERAQIERDADGEPRLGIGTVQDITERHKTKEKMRMLALAVEQSYNTIVITDLNANIQYANAAFFQATGYTTAEALGKNPRILQSGKTPKSTYEDMWTHLTAGYAWRGELINRRKDGSEYHESVMISPVRQADGQITHYLAIKEDITKLRHAEESIQQLANFDLLTGLPNRALLNERVSHAIGMIQSNQVHLAVLLLDLDHFKHINDNLGHPVGDTLLMELANRLEAVIRREDILSRLSGDEFILVLPDTDTEGATHVAEKILWTVAQPYHIAHQDLVVTASIGIAMYPDNGHNFEMLAQCADVAMYRAKQNGRNTFRFFTPDMQTHSARQLLLENALRHALQHEQFYLHYQPQIDLQQGRVVGAEALLRWQHPTLGAISPGEFIPIAEDSGQILQIGEWVLRTAVMQLKRWIAAGMSPISIAVNLSVVQFYDPKLPELVSTLLAESHIPPYCLELELTESMAMNDPTTAIAMMNALHQQGVRMSIDDFGTGYSSLNYLKRFKVDKLKIDQSFVRHLTNDPDDKAIVTAIINMANSLGFHTLAEGVETAGQLAFLRTQGCDEIQGYYFSKPLATAEFEQFVTQNHTQHPAVPSKDEG